jgi:hypothetical protein
MLISLSLLQKLLKLKKFNSQNSEGRANCFSFDLPLLKSEPVTKLTTKSIMELTNETRDIKVNEPVEFVPVTELSENGIIKYSLESIWKQTLNL